MRRGDGCSDLFGRLPDHLLEHVLELTDTDMERVACTCRWLRRVVQPLRLLIAPTADGAYAVSEGAVPARARVIRLQLGADLEAGRRALLANGGPLVRRVDVHAHAHALFADRFASLRVAECLASDAGRIAFPGLRELRAFSLPTRKRGTAEPTQAVEAWRLEADDGDISQPHVVVMRALGDALDDGLAGELAGR